MSTTFSVLPRASEIPSLRDVVELSTLQLHKFLSSYDIKIRPSIDIILHRKEPDEEHYTVLDAPAKWDESLYAWFFVPTVKGGTDAYFMMLDDDSRECWRDELIDSNRVTTARKQHILAWLENDHFWCFRRSAGQPGIINLAYGLIAASVAQLTDGLIYSGDSAWDYQRFPATAAEFFEWYFRPELAIGSSFKEWSERCIRSLASELTG